MNSSPLAPNNRSSTLPSRGQAPVAAHVPVVYGCSHACTFCIIPFRRGVERSRSVEEIVNEVRGLVAPGRARSHPARTNRRPLWL